MPLPLLLIPAAAAAASSGPAISTIIGATAAAVAAGGTAAASTFWWIFSKHKKHEQAHEESLRSQADMTQNRIEEARQAMEAIPQALEVFTQEVQHATSSTSASVSRLKQLSGELNETKNELKAATVSSEEASEHLAQLHEECEVLLKETERASIYLSKDTLVKELQGNITSLTARCSEQDKAIESLMSLIEKQNKQLEVFLEREKQQQPKTSHGAHFFNIFSMQRHKDNEQHHNSSERVILT